MGRAGRNYGRDGSWKVVWPGFERVGAKNSWNFSLRALARFTDATAAAHRGARDGHRQRFIVRRAARSTARMDRGLPRSTGRCRRNDDRHANADRQRGRIERSAISIFPPAVFSAQQALVDRCAGDGSVVQRPADRAGRRATITGNSSLSGLVRLRSDPSQAARVAASLAGDSVFVARGE